MKNVWNKAETMVANATPEEKKTFSRIGWSAIVVIGIAGGLTIKAITNAVRKTN